MVGLISMSTAAYARFLAGPGGEAGARVLLTAERDTDAVFALRYVAKKKGVLVCAFESMSAPSDWLSSPVLDLCRLLADAKDTAQADIVLVSSGIMNYRDDPIAYAFTVTPGALAQLETAPGWQDPRLMVLDELLKKTVFATLQKVGDPTRATRKLVDAALRKNARKTACRRLEEERVRAINDAIAAAAAGKTVRPFLVAKDVTFDGRVVRYVTGRVLADADPCTMRRLSASVVADQRYVWCFGRRVPDASGATFKILGGVDGIYAVDDQHAFVEDCEGYRIIAAADPKTFRCLSYGCACDAHDVYFRGEVLEGVGGHFTLDRCGFLRGQHAVYHYGFALPLDPATFEVLDLERKLKDTNPFMGEFRLKDRSGTYRYDSHTRLVERDTEA
jgi:hypothetical protein